MFILMHHSCVRYFDLKAETAAETLNVVFTVEDILVRTMLDFFCVNLCQKVSKSLKDVCDNYRFIAGQTDSSM